MTTVTHIVPLFAPVIDGVGDYALNLAKTLRTGHSINSQFVVADPIWQGPTHIDGFAVSGPTSFETARLLDAIRKESCIVLHYVGYGYDRKGVPRCLVDAIDQWRAANAKARLITVFHEIWSSGPPWRSVFYLAPLQRRLAVRLLQASDRAFTNALWSLRKLNRMKPGLAEFLPVSANIFPADEPTAHPRGTKGFWPLIFGQEWTRLHAVRAHENFLRSFQKDGRLETVLVMGKGARLDPPSPDVEFLQTFLPADRITVVGEKSAADAAEIFDRADFLLSAVRDRDLCKSSSVMSAFACGCPVVLKLSGRETAPLEWRHFILTTDSECDLKHLDAFALRRWNLQRVAAHARSWFLANAAWPVIAARIAAALEKPLSQAVPAEK